MNAIVFEHVPVAELPAEWRAKLAQVTLTLAPLGDEARRFSDQPNF